MLATTLAAATAASDAARLTALGTAGLCEGDLLTLGERLETVTHDVREVNEQVVTLVVAGEAETLRVVEETHDGFVAPRRRGALREVRVTHARSIGARCTLREDALATRSPVTSLDARCSV